jgi:hypothetical protein
MRDQLVSLQLRVMLSSPSTHRLLRRFRALLHLHVSPSTISLNLYIDSHWSPSIVVLPAGLHSFTPQIPYSHNRRQGFHRRPTLSRRHVIEALTRLPVCHAAVLPSVSDDGRSMCAGLGPSSRGAGAKANPGVSAFAKGTDVSYLCGRTSDVIS